MGINIDEMDDAEIAAWFENAEPEDFDFVVDGEALVALRARMVCRGRISGVR